MVVITVKSLGYVVIEATDVAAWRSFATEVVGMVVAPAMADNDSLYLKMDEYCWRVCVVPGDIDRLSCAGWELADAEALQRAREHFLREGVPFEEGSAEQAKQRRLREFIRLRDPSGFGLELFHGMALDYGLLHSPAGVSEFVTGYHGNMGLGHFVIPTADLQASHDFYARVLGFGQTDYMHFHFSGESGDPGQGLHFLHVDNPRHHSLALFQDPDPPACSCVHLMVEVPDIDAVGYFMDRCKQRDIAVVSELGRHTNDLMLSVYVQTPGGFALEFGCGGVQLDWNHYTPTVSLKPSLWGHSWPQGEEA